MEGPLVSIIMPVYNREEYVGESIESVLSQTYGNFQFIIVDDGSTDSSWAVISSFADERIEAVKNPVNRHIAYAINCAFDRVRGDYIAFIDSDDRWEAEKLEKQLSLMEQHPEYACCFTHANLIGEKGENVNEKYARILALFNAENTSREEWLRYFFFKGNRLVNPSSLFRRYVWESIGYLNPCLVQAVDLDFWVRMTLKFSFVILPERLLLGLTTISDDKETISAYGLMELYKALSNRKIADVLAEQYGLTTGKIAALNGRHILNDPYIAIEHIHERDALIQKEKEESEHWKKEYETVISSKTWQTATKLKNLFKK